MEMCIGCHVYLMASVPYCCIRVLYQGQPPIQMGQLNEGVKGNGPEW